MHLTLIEVDGYKSFGDPVRVALGGGITCFVGPNGAGKSNLAVDSLMFTCGERSWTRQRAEDGMKDLIFSGTDKRPQAERAEVTLTFDNFDRRIPINANEVEIRRVLQREGPAKIEINGQTMTLKQARPYLMATGLGPESPQIVRQGTIQLVVGGDSAAIAQAISHAAGISYYLARRQEAETKLAQVREQLETIDVRLKEAQEALASARIRAGRARRRRQMKRERQALEMALGQVRRRELDEKIAKELRQQNELSAQKGAHEKEAARLKGEVAEAERALAGMLADRPKKHDGRGDGPRLPDDPTICRLAGRIMSEVAGRLEGSSKELLADWQKHRAEASQVVREAIEDLDELLEDPPTEAKEEEPHEANLADVLEQKRHALEEARVVLQDLSTRIAQGEGRLEILRAQRQQLGVPAPPPELGQLALPNEAAQIEKQIRQLDSKLASFGRVDETAEEEAGRLEAEVARLKGPATQDLRQVVPQIAAIIEKMDEAMRIRRNQALVRVRDRFQEFFANVFGGGRATLHWEEPQDEHDQNGEGEGDLNAGESREPRAWIEVQLPGKPREPMSLLSGGQKSLCGIAFVAAVAQAAVDESGSKAKSGPPIVLDEADAALEEANSLRFVQLVQAIAHHSQVLCITHNRRVMEAADMLYGVTMEQPGVSVVVGARFQAMAAANT